MGLSRSHMKVYLGGTSVTQPVLLKSVVLCAAIGTGDPNTTINPGLVNVDSAATLIKNLKSQFAPCKQIEEIRQGLAIQHKRADLKEINLRVTCLRQSFMP